MVMNVYYNIVIISMFLITRKPEHPFTLMDLLGYLVYGLPVHIMCLFFFVVVVDTDICPAIFLTHASCGSSLHPFHF